MPTYRFFAAFLAFFIAMQTLSAPPTQFDALTGQWEGSWEINRGMELTTGTFRLSFERSPGGPKGRFVALEVKTIHFESQWDGSGEFKRKVETEELPSRSQKIDKIERTSADPPSYRWDANDDCWNVSIAGGLMTGIRNGGPCSSIGLGSGARLISIEAKKIQSLSLRRQ